MGRRSEPLPGASLASRASRLTADTSEPNYYLDLADIALGRSTGSGPEQKDKGKA